MAVHVVTHLMRHVRMISGAAFVGMVLCHGTFSRADDVFRDAAPSWIGSATSPVTPVGWREADQRCLSHATCDRRSRGTLMQWSYGTSFSGGPNLAEPLVTDRPDFTEASSTVGRGVLQVEMGYTFTSDDDGPGTSRSHTYPETLFRYGVLADWLELRIVKSVLSAEDGTGSRTGFEDMQLGFKIALTPQEGLLPEMALIPQMTVPTGDGAFSANEVLPGLNWVYSWEVSDEFSIAGSTQFNRSIDAAGDAYTEWAQSWALGYALTDELGAYAEWYAFFPHSGTGVSDEHYLNGGFTYLITNDIQWDIRGGVGLNSAADDFFVGTGLSIRFQ